MSNNSLPNTPPKSKFANIPANVLAFYDGTQTIISGFVGLIEGIFTDTVTRLAPILAPLPPAFSVYTAMSLNAPQWVAIATAGAIELIGMFSSKVAVTSWNWNKTRQKSEPESPFYLALGMAAVYFVVVLVLAASIEIFPNATQLIYLGFVFIAASTYVSSAVNIDLKNWQRERIERQAQQAVKRGLAADIRDAQSRLDSVLAESKTLLDSVEKLTAERDALQQQIDQQRAAQTAANSGKSNFKPGDLNALELARDTKQMQITERRERVAVLFKSGKKTSEMAALLGCSPDTIRKDIKQLNGKLIAQKAN